LPGGSSAEAAYGHPPPGTHLIVEDDPLGQNLRRWDHYARAKILAEREVARLGDRVSIIRPTWMYGPRDRTILPRIVESLRRGRVVLIGDGANVLNLLHASDVAEGLVLAGEARPGNGKAYNLCSDGEITQMRFFDLLCDRLDLPRITRRVPAGVAHAVGLACEATAKFVPGLRPPVTRQALSLLSRSPRYSNEKARRELGWRPEVRIEVGLSETLDWMIATRP
jgi:nucleoside-diphosphate-sugar epimerase